METNKKQTAVEWMLDCLIAQGYAKDTALFRDIVSESRKREREQVVKFSIDYVNNCCYSPITGDIACNKTAEQYYEETYGK